jgi:hypothetical protein
LSFLVCKNTFKTDEEGVNDLVDRKYGLYHDGITKNDIITLPNRNYTRSTFATKLKTQLSASVKKSYVKLPAAEKFVWIFDYAYDLNSNTFNITSKLPATNLDARNS